MDATLKIKLESLTTHTAKEFDNCLNENTGKTYKQLFDLAQSADDTDEAKEAREIIRYCRIHRPNDWNEYKEAKEKFDETKYYKPANMKHINLPPQTFNVIASRPSRGKTSLMTSLLVDALTQKKNVVFITLEETFEQVTDRLFLYAVHEQAKQNNSESDLFREWTATDDNLSKNNLTVRGILNSVLQRLFKNERPEYTTQHALKTVNNLTQVYTKKTVENWIESGQLVIKDMAENNITEINQFLKQYPDRVVFLDYLQLIRPDRTSEMQAFSRQNELQQIIESLRNCIKNNNQILLTGAQLNREGTTDKDNDFPDDIHEYNMREAGDIETTAYTIIGLLRNGAELSDDKFNSFKKYGAGKVYAYKILKNRYGGGIDETYYFSCDMAYSHIEPTSEKCEIQKPKAERKKDAPAPTEKKAKSNTYTSADIY